MLTPENAAKIAQIATALARTPEGATAAEERLCRELFAAKGGTADGLRIAVRAAFDAGRESERLSRKP